MGTQGQRWEEINVELTANWEWMNKLTAVQQSNAVLALGAGLP